VKWKLRTVAALVVVFAFVAGGALVSLATHGWVGVVVGAVVGSGLGGVAAGYVPTFQDKAEQRRKEAEQAVDQRDKAQKRLLAASEPPLGEALRKPSLLLRPERAVVDFFGRADELERLRTWLGLERRRSVRVVVGAGGIGKTRLALQVATEWEASGRTWVQVAAGKEAGVLEEARGTTSGPLLLVLDYAETRAGLGDLLRAVLDDPGPVRVLLLARSLNEWWDRLAEASPPAVSQLLFEANPIRLEGPIDNRSDAELAAAAMPFFAAIRGVPPPGDVIFDLPSRRVPLLVLHAAALVAVLRSETNPMDSLRIVITEGVLGELMNHEARYWRRAASSSGLPQEGWVLKSVTAAAILLGADDQQEAAATVARVPDLAGASAGDLLRWARWLYDLYPAEPDGRLGMVQPDLLAEHHVATQLTASPGLIQAFLRDLTLNRSERALTVLARAWELHENVGPLIEAALRANATELAIPAADVAIQTQAKVGELLASALRDAPATLESLIEIAEAMPFPSVALAQADLAVTLRICSELPSGAERDTIARWSLRTGRRLWQVGRLAEALPVTEEAVEIFRELAAATPDRFRPDLAESLVRLGVRFSELGRPADALRVTEEAVEIFRELAAATPDRFRPDLAESLNNLGVMFSELGRFADALRPAQQAVAIFRELASAMPDRYRTDLARSLNNLSTRLWKAGDLAEALPVTEEAVAIFREMAAIAPDRYRPYLAQSLDNLSFWLAELGRRTEALPVIEEAVAIRRELTAATPDRYRPYLARSLDNLGVRLSELGRSADALRVTEEAVGIFRELAAAVPDRYSSDLAESLDNLGARLSELGRPAEAVPATEEAVAIFRELSEGMPERYRPDLARSLKTLHSVLAVLGRTSEAAAAHNEAQAVSELLD
jgi:tetratricopeptide (TPR) repeat protein